MSSAASYLACALAVIVAGYKLFRARNETGNQAMAIRCLCGFFLCLGLGMTVMAPMTLIAAGGIEPVPNLTRFLGNALEMCAAHFLLLLAHAVESPARARARLPALRAVLAAGVTAMGALLLAGDTEFTLNFVNVYSTNVAIVGYLAVFFGYIGWCMVVFIPPIVRYSRRAEPMLFRISLRIVTAAGAVGVLWTAWSGVRPPITLLTGVPLGTTVPVGSILGSVCIALWVLGATLPLWGRYPVRVWRRARAVRAYRQINPLWTELYLAMPEIALSEPDGGARLDEGIEFALYRRIIEIRDAQLALRVHQQPGLAARATAAARGAREPDVSAVVEAAGIAAALRARADGVRYVRHDRGDAAGGEHVEPNVAAEAERLAVVSRAFAESPVVQRFRGEPAVPGEPGTAGAKAATPPA